MLQAGFACNNFTV